MFQKKEVTSELNPSKIIENSQNIDIDENNKVEKTTYCNDKYYITVFKFIGNDLSCFNELCKPYEILQSVWPELIKIFKYKKDKKLIYAIPRYNTDEDTIYKSLIEELIRFTSFFYYTALENENGDQKIAETMSAGFVGQYINFIVPSK